jgi:hypothetical protein
LPTPTVPLAVIATAIVAEETVAAAIVVTAMIAVAVAIAMPSVHPAYPVASHPRLHSMV